MKLTLTQQQMRLLCPIQKLLYVSLSAKSVLIQGSPVRGCRCMQRTMDKHNDAHGGNMTLIHQTADAAQFEALCGRVGFLTFKSCIYHMHSVQ